MPQYADHRERIAETVRYCVDAALWFAIGFVAGGIVFMLLVEVK